MMMRSLPWDLEGFAGRVVRQFFASLEPLQLPVSCLFITYVMLIIYFSTVFISDIEYYTDFPYLPWGCQLCSQVNSLVVLIVPVLPGDAVHGHSHEADVPDHLLQVV